MSKKECKNLIEAIIKEVNEKKAEQVCCYDLTESDWFCEYVIIISAKNKIHCKAIQESIEKRSAIYLKKEHSDDYYEHAKLKGKAESGWVIIDLNSIICHCITEDLRESYDLDALMKKKTQTIIY
eukprot:COSAG01_NODE_2480_length_7606_cov_41.116291_3_plen_125_part_00